MPKRLLKDSFLYGIADFVSKGFAALLFPLFAKYLTVNEFGILALITIISSMIGMFIESGINNAIQLFYFEKRFDERKKILVSTGLSLQAFIGIFCVSFFLIIIYPLQNFLLERYQIKWEWLLLSVLIVLPNLLIRYCLNILRLHFKPILFGIISFFSNLAWMFLAIYLMRNEAMGISGYLIANLVLLLVILPFSIIAIHKDIGIKLDKSVGVEIYKIGFPFIFSNLAFWLFGSLDRLILAEYSDVIQVGLYSIAFKFSAIITMVHIAFGQAWSPMLMKYLNNEEKGKKIFLDKIAEIYLAALSAICCIVILFCEDLFVLLTPKEYWPALIPTGIIILGLFINSTTQFTAIGISFTKRTKYINFSSWIAVIVNIIFTIPLSKYMGATGSSIALVITYISLTVSYNYFSNKVFFYSFNFNALLLPLLFMVISFIMILIAEYSKINFNPVFIVLKLIIISVCCINLLRVWKNHSKSFKTLVL